MPLPQERKWERSSPQLAALFEELAPRGSEIVHKKMFGWPCCFLNGNLFTGLHKENIIFRLSETDLAAFLKLDGAAEFEPMAGRKMKGYGIWAEPLKRDRAALTHWIERSQEFARSLPAKAARKIVGKKPATKKAAKAKP